MATVQHIYLGDGDPNGVVTTAAPGSHYIDQTLGEPWLCADAPSGEDAYWVQLQRAGTWTVGATFTTSPGADRFVVQSSCTITFEWGGEVYSNVEPTRVGDAWVFDVATTSLVEIHPGSAPTIVVTPLTRYEVPA